VRSQLRRRAPAISVDTKKKELIGDFKNPGWEWRPKGKPKLVRVHDFIVPDQGKAIPYGVHDLRSSITVAPATSPRTDPEEVAGIAAEVEPPDRIPRDRTARAYRNASAATPGTASIPGATLSGIRSWRVASGS